MSETLIKEVESKMLTTINHLVDEFATIRTGRANPALVDKLTVEYYGTKTPLQQLATISVPDPKLLVIQPFDKNSLDEIEKSILNADIGLNPTNDGEVVRIAPHPRGRPWRQLRWLHRKPGPSAGRSRRRSVRQTGHRADCWR